MGKGKSSGERESIVTKSSKSSKSSKMLLAEREILLASGADKGELDLRVLEKITSGPDEILNSLIAEGLISEHQVTRLVRDAQGTRTEKSLAYLLTPTGLKKARRVKSQLRVKAQKAKSQSQLRKAQREISKLNLETLSLPARDVLHKLLELADKEHSLNYQQPPATHAYFVEEFKMPKGMCTKAINELKEKGLVDKRSRSGQICYQLAWPQGGLLWHHLDTWAEHGKQSFSEVSMRAVYAMSG